MTAANLTQQISTMRASIARLNDVIQQCFPASAGKALRKLKSEERVLAALLAKKAEKEGE